MLALEGSFAYSLLLGMFAAVNPCGFVLLPTYLLYFLGLEAGNADTQRAGIKRALLVGGAVSAGFITVFLIVGTVSRLFTSGIVANAKYASLVIGVAMMIGGGFMLAGWRPPISGPNLRSGAAQRRTVASMFGFGVAYAVASIGCTIGFLVSAVFGSFAANGYVSGVVSVALYGVGMSLIVTALTVALAVTGTTLLRRLRRLLRYVDRIAAVFVIATGAYLTWYWYAAITNRGGDAVVGRVDGWQSDLVNFLQGQGVLKLAVVFVAVVGVGVLYVWVWPRIADRRSKDDHVDDQPSSSDNSLPNSPSSDASLADASSA